MSTAKFNQVALLGCGTIGSGIAIFLALKGIHVHVYSRTSDSSQSARNRIFARFQSLNKLEFIEQDTMNVASQRIIFIEELSDALGKEMLILESISENLQEKQSLYSLLDDLVMERTIIASNTSSLRLQDVFKPVSDKRRVVGLHWFTPADLIPLVELGNAGNTAEEVLDDLERWLSSLGKVTIRLENPPPGYIVNRIQAAILRESCDLVERYGIAPEVVDKAIMYSIGLRYGTMGCFRTADCGGLDIFGILMANLLPTLSSETEVPKVIKKMLEMGHYGARSGRGFSMYSPDDIPKIITERDLWLRDALRIRNQL